MRREESPKSISRSTITARGEVQRNVTQRPSNIKYNTSPNIMTHLINKKISKNNDFTKQHLKFFGPSNEKPELFTPPKLSTLHDSTTPPRFSPCNSLDFSPLVHSSDESYLATKRQHTDRLRRAFIDTTPTNKKRTKSSGITTPKLEKEVTDIEASLNLASLEFTVLSLESQLGDLQDTHQTKDRRIRDLENELKEQKQFILEEQMKSITDTQVYFERVASDGDTRDVTSEKCQISLLQETVISLTNEMKQLKTKRLEEIKALTQKINISEVAHIETKQSFLRAVQKQESLQKDVYRLREELKVQIREIDKGQDHHGEDLSRLTEMYESSTFQMKMEYEKKMADKDEKNPILLAQLRKLKRDFLEHKKSTSRALELAKNNFAENCDSVINYATEELQLVIETNAQLQGDLDKTHGHIGSLENEALERTYEYDSQLLKWRKEMGEMKEMKKLQQRRQQQKNRRTPRTTTTPMMIIRNASDDITNISSRFSTPWSWNRVTRSVCEALTSRWSGHKECRRLDFRSGIQTEQVFAELNFAKDGSEQMDTSDFVDNVSWN